MGNGSPSSTVLAVGHRKELVILQDLEKISIDFEILIGLNFDLSGLQSP